MPIKFDKDYKVHASEFIESDVNTPKFKTNYSVECFELIETDEELDGVHYCSGEDGSKGSKGAICCREFIEE